jgi:hypothetical protein
VGLNIINLRKNSGAGSLATHDGGGGHSFLETQPRINGCFCDRLFNLGNVLFYIPVWLNVAKHEYPASGLKSGVCWYDFFSGQFSKYRKRSVVKSEKSKRKRHWAFVEAHREASTPIISVSDKDFSDPYWWVGVFGFEVENIDVKHDGYAHLFSKSELKHAFSPKIPVWLYLSVEVLKRIVEYAINYLNDVHDKKILLMNVVKNKLLVLYYLVRFSEKYLRKVKHDIIERGKYLKRLSSLGYKATFISFTIRISDYHNYQQILDVLSKMFHKAMAYLSNYIDWIDYIKFFEIGPKRNTIHIHVLLINRPGFINSDIVRSAWSDNGELIGGIKIKYFDNVNGGVAYALKYVTKLIQYDYNADVNKLRFEKGFILLSLLWATNKRLFSVSARFTKEIRRQIILELVRATAKNSVMNRWFGFVVEDPNLMYYTKKYSDLSPPKVIPGEWEYIGSFASDMLPLPPGIYDYDMVKEYLYPLFRI